MTCLYLSFLASSLPCDPLGAPDVTRYGDTGKRHFLKVHLRGYGEYIYEKLKNTQQVCYIIQGDKIEMGTGLDRLQNADGKASWPVRRTL